MKKTILTGIATAALAFSASAEVKVGNPMAVTGPIPDLVAPMVLAVDLAAQHVNEQGGLFSDGQKYIIKIMAFGQALKRYIIAQSLRRGDPKMPKIYPPTW